VDKIYLNEPVRDERYHHHVLFLSRLAVEIADAKTKDELKEILCRINQGRAIATSLSRWIDMGSFERVDDLDLLKQRILVNVIGYRMHLKYTSVKSATGPKSDRLRRFFDSITNDPQDVYDLADQFQLAYSVIKQHKRYDTFPERGQTKIKKGMIFRVIT